MQCSNSHSKARLSSLAQCLLSGKWAHTKLCGAGRAPHSRRWPGVLPSLPAVCRPTSFQMMKPLNMQERFSISSERPRYVGTGSAFMDAGEYPAKLRDAANPVELLYYQGWWDLVSSRSIAVVGTRKPSQEGLKRTESLVTKLVEHDFTVVSGLAAGIDRMAHETAIGEGGRTIAVIGTPLSHSYPRENAELQRYIADHFLVVSQIPVKKYEERDYRHNRSFFPERNVTMSALTEATIIVEAGETSGTLIQARAALRQNRKLFILDSCFQNPRLTWPATLEARGAIRVRDYDDIRRNLPAATAPHR